MANFKYDFVEYDGAPFADEEYDGFALKDLEPGTKFIGLPKPRDRHGRGGFTSRYGIFTLLDAGEEENEYVVQRCNDGKTVTQAGDLEVIVVE